MNRRDFLLSAPAASLMVACPKVFAAAPTSIRLIDSGGTTGESIAAAYIPPFTEKYGVRVVREAPSSLGKLRAMVESGRINAALFELGSSTLAQARELNLLEKLDWTAIHPDPMFAEARDDYAMGYQYFSTVMAWRDGNPAPKTWANFFDVQHFPGKRCMSAYPHYTLPFALLADGVDPASLFPLDVDRAMRKLERIKSHVSVWWKTGTQPLQLLKDNEVQYAVTWSAGIEREPGIRSTFNQGMYDIAWLVVPRGQPAATKDLAMKFLHEVTVAKNQMVAARVLPLSGNSPQLEGLLGAKAFQSFPTAKANLQAQFKQNAQWWQKNGTEVNKVWSNFLLNT